MGNPKEFTVRSKESVAEDSKAVDCQYIANTIKEVKKLSEASSNNEGDLIVDVLLNEGKTRHTPVVNAADKDAMLRTLDRLELAVRQGVEVPLKGTQLKIANVAPGTFEHIYQLVIDARNLVLRCEHGDNQQGKS